MKKIKIDFVDFWKVDKNNNIITNTLKEKYEVEISNEPDYIFCSLFGNEHFKYKKAIKILVLGENIAPNFDLYDYAIGFYNIKYDDRYLKYNILLDEEIYNIIKKRSKINTVKDEFCAFVYRSNYLNSKRIEILDKLNEYKRVDCGGNLKNNIGKSIGNEKIDKINFQKKYKFVIACENQQFPEYNTEKLFEAFASNAIPIYSGDPKIGEIYNEKAFINCDNFKNLDEMLKLVSELDNDNEKYLNMLNQPVFKEDDYYEKQKKQLKEFLYNIFEKDIDGAKKVHFNKNYYIYKFYKKYLFVNTIQKYYLRIIKSKIGKKFFKKV